MKRYIYTFALAVALLLTACSQRERTLVILSTNDMHGKIQRFPHLTIFLL